jgi:hypothetical protein
VTRSRSAMNKPWLPAITALITLSLLATAAHADDAEAARGLFERARDHDVAGRYDKACPLLAESYKLDPHPGTLFALAECQLKRGHFGAAAARYDDYLALYATLSPDKKNKQADREKQAREQRAALSSKVAELTLVLVPSWYGMSKERVAAPSALPGTVVTCDGAVVQEKALGVPFPVDPGDHVIAAQAPGVVATEVRVTLVAGERRAVALERGLRGEPKETAAQPRTSDTAKETSITTPEADPSSPDSSGPNLGIVIAGGVVTVAAAITTGVLTKVSADGILLISNIKNLLGPGGCLSTANPYNAVNCGYLRRDYELLAGYQNASIALGITAGTVGAATLIYEIVARRRSRAVVTITPSFEPHARGLTVRGAW